MALIFCPCITAILLSVDGQFGMFIRQILPTLLASNILVYTFPVLWFLNLVKQMNLLAEVVSLVRLYSKGLYYSHRSRNTYGRRNDSRLLLFSHSHYNRFQLSSF